MRKLADIFYRDREILARGRIDMEGTIGLEDRDVAKETLWYMMASGSRYKVDEVVMHDPREVVCATIRYRYYKEDDDVKLVEYAADYAETLKEVKDDWHVGDPDDCNLLMLDVLKMTIQVNRAFEYGCLDQDVYENLMWLLDAKVHDICSTPPGPSAKLLELFEKYTEGEDDE